MSTKSTKKTKSAKKTKAKKTKAKKTKAVRKSKPNFQHVERHIEIDLDGNVHDQPYSMALENDLRLLWAKDFWEKWCEKIFEKPFEEVFKEDDFCGQDGRAQYDGLFNSYVFYSLTFTDGSKARVSYELDDSSGHVEVETDDDASDDSWAYDFMKNRDIYEWTTDTLDDLADKCAKKSKVPAIDFSDYVTFHGEIYWYTADCYPAAVLKELNKLKAQTYSVKVGNTTSHYFTNMVPKEKDFNYGNSNFNPIAANMGDKFWKGLRAYIRSQKRFITDPEVSKQITKLSKKSL